MYDLYALHSRAARVAPTVVVVVNKGLQAVVDSTTEGLEAIVAVFEILHEGFEALRSRKWLVFIS